MLRAAQLYEDELRTMFIEQWYKPENIFYDGGAGDSFGELPAENYENHCFVSVDGDDNVIGYIAYSVDWAAMSVSNLGIISFDKGNLLFAKDVWKAICDIFEVYHMNRLSFWCFADNPAIKAYRNFIRLHGGRECGYRRQSSKLQDGKLHDDVEFEIMASEFRR